MSTESARLQKSLARLAARASLDPSFLGYALSGYQRRHGLTDALLAADLGCSVDTLVRLRLCGAIRAEKREEDLRAVAEGMGVEVGKLKEVV